MKKIKRRLKMDFRESMKVQPNDQLIQTDVKAIKQMTIAIRNRLIRALQLPAGELSKTRREKEETEKRLQEKEEAEKAAIQQGLIYMISLCRNNDIDIEQIIKEIKQEEINPIESSRLLIIGSKITVLSDGITQKLEGNESEKAKGKTLEEMIKEYLGKLRIVESNLGITTLEILEKQVAEVLEERTGGAEKGE
jgi:hypothetical protein